MLLTNPNPAPKERSMIPRLAFFNTVLAARPNEAKITAIHIKVITAKINAVNQSGMNLMWLATCR